MHTHQGTADGRQDTSGQVPGHVIAQFGHHSASYEAVDYHQDDKRQQAECSTQRGHSTHELKVERDIVGGNLKRVSDKYRETR
jgi:hypothetical protein